MNLNALRDRCESRFGDTTNRIITDTEWLDYLNDAYMEVVAAEPNWPFLETRTTNLVVTAGTGEVALPTDVWRVTAVYNATDGIPLAPIPGQAQFRSYFPSPSSNPGIPLWYRLRGSTLEVYPYASAATTLHVDHPAPPAALNAGGDEPAFPEHHHRLLVVGALAKAYEDYPDKDVPNAPALYEARFQRGIEKMRVELLLPRHDGYPTIVDDGV